VCALICRVITIILEIYGLILSSFYVLPSCYFITAISTNDEPHGVGLKSFETDQQECIPHNSFIKESYNGMEMTAKICGYVAPALAACVVVWLLGESCTRDGCWSGKCIPSLLMMGTVACQGLTFIIYNSDLFCKNEDIKECGLGAAAYTSIQACVVYAVAFILYYIAPTPKPFTGMMGATVSTASTSKTGGGDGAKKKKKSTPDAGEDYTKEMYAQRRKEKKIKSRGVSGRSKKEIFEDINGDGNKSKSRKEEPYDESQIVLYDPEKGQRRDKERRRERNDSSGRKDTQPLYGDYVDEPDGMDWSAYSPNERDEYQERKRAKKKQREREKKEEERRERERRELEKERHYDDRRYDDRRRSQDDETYQSEYTEDVYYRRPSRGDETEYTEDQYDDRYEDSYRGNDYGYGRHSSSYRSSRNDGRRGSYDYDDGYSYQSGQDEFSAYDSRAGDTYDDRSYDEHGRSGGGYDDSSYGYDSRADDYYESPRSRNGRGYYS